MICKNCGKQLAEDAKICDVCGQMVVIENSEAAKQILDNKETMVENNNSQPIDINLNQAESNQNDITSKIENNNEEYTENESSHPTSLWTNNIQSHPVDINSNQIEIDNEQHQDDINSALPSESNEIKKQIIDSTDVVQSSENNKMSIFNKYKKVIIALVIIIIILVVIKLVSNAGIGTGSNFVKGNYDMICHKKEINKNDKSIIVTETKYKFKDIGKYVTSTTEIRMYKKAGNTINEEAVDAALENFKSNTGLEVKLIDDDKTLFIKYSNSHLLYPDISDIKPEFKKNGFKCR